MSVFLGASALTPADLTSFDEYIGKEDAHLAAALRAFEGAVRKIGQEINTAGLRGLFGLAAEQASSSGRDQPKKLDVTANEILKDALSGSGVIAAMASEEEESVVDVQNAQHLQFAAVFDPLDGSSNIDACIPTGTILGIYPYNGSAEASVLQQGSSQVAAAYALYSSALMLVMSCGKGVQGFTLDPGSQKFYLTHDIQIPSRGQYYSLNDARQFDWPSGLRRYVDDVRQGKGQSQKQYSARYVCSLVADFHRTLLYGGWAGNPRKHLRLLYEANPLSYLAEQAGGMGSTGVDRILSLKASSLHERLPVFLGSPEDIRELESYGDVQQLGQKKYSA